MWLMKNSRRRLYGVAQAYDDPSELRRCYNTNREEEERKRSANMWLTVVMSAHLRSPVHLHPQSSLYRLGRRTRCARHRHLHPRLPILPRLGLRLGMRTLPRLHMLLGRDAGLLDSYDGAGQLPPARPDSPYDQVDEPVDPEHQELGRQQEACNERNDEHCRGRRGPRGGEEEAHECKC